MQGDDRIYHCKVKGCKESFTIPQQLGGHMAAHRLKGEYKRNLTRKGKFVIHDRSKEEFLLVEGTLEVAEGVADDLARSNGTRAEDMAVYGISQEYSCVPQGLKLKPKKK